MRRDVYSGRLKLSCEDRETFQAVVCYASSLVSLERFDEAKALMRKNIPVARRVLGNNDETTIRMRWSYALALYADSGATLDDLREAVRTLEDLQRTARRVLGSTHPVAKSIDLSLATSREALRAREGLNSISEAMAAMPPPGSA